MRPNLFSPTIASHFLRTQGKAKCEAQIDVGQLQFSGAGEKPTSMKQSFMVGLEYIDGRWWIRI